MIGKSTMKVSSIALVALLFAAANAWAEYDKAAVVQVMRQNISKINEAKTAAAKADYFAAATAFFDIAKGMNGIKAFNPYKGEQENWEKTIDAVVAAAFRGIGASAEKDLAGVNKQIAELQALNKAGHSAHK
jgi:hypothetical protein